MRRLLVANRGEIACRIIRSARSMGIETLAVYSEADRDAAHVAMADAAFLLGPAPARQSYLDGARILAAARHHQVDAVHPGYGFLSESAAFAQTVIDEGLTWVGAAPRTILAMGDKQTARETARRAGVPVVPGSSRFAMGELEGLASAAEAVGFPLLVKATAGGGGIGMRKVDDPGQLEAVAQNVQKAAEKTFGDDKIYLERFIRRSRHVEVQVFGFGDGRAMHLFERDCSLQRRFQKVIEEAPAPDMPAAALERMREYAIDLCRETAYEGAGTIEFIWDVETQEFFFLEMNTRIQVEHPVTEMLTGVDLVRMQLRQADGQALNRHLKDVKADGAALECRIYAENPNKQFFPSPGTLHTFRLPDETSNLRIDTGYRQGDVVSPFYDPLLAKLVAWGSHRDEAIERALSALEAIVVEGLVTNCRFLSACLRSPDFREGRISTRFIEEHIEELCESA